MVRRACDCRAKPLEALPPAAHPGHGLAASETVPMRKPSTVEPYAGKPPVRFGGRRGQKSSLPLSPISAEAVLESISLGSWVLGRDNWDVSDEVWKKYIGDQKPEIPHDRRVGQSAHGPIDPALRRRRGISAPTGVQVSGQRRGEDSAAASLVYVFEHAPFPNGRLPGGLAADLIHSRPGVANSLLAGKNAGNFDRFSLFCDNPSRKHSRIQQFAAEFPTRCNSQAGGHPSSFGAGIV